MFKIKFNIFKNYEENPWREDGDEITYDFFVFLAKNKMFLYEFVRNNEFDCVSCEEGKYYIRVSRQVRGALKKNITAASDFDKDELVTI